MLRSILPLLAAFMLAGCDGQVQSVGSLSVGDQVPPGDAPDLKGMDVVSWGCDGDSTPATGRARPPQCVDRATYTIIYRDARWQYNVKVVDGRVEGIDRYYLDAWP